MYFREKKTKTTPVLQLVKAVRQKDGRIQQKIIVSLGQQNIPEQIRKAVALHVENILNGYQPLYPLALEESKWVDYILKKYRETETTSDIAGIRTDATGATNKQSTDQQSSQIINGVLLEQVKHENATMLGPLLVLEQVWKELQLSEFFRMKNFTTSQINAAKCSIYNRLISPGSENSLPSWVRTTAMNELLHEQFEMDREDRFYRISDRLLMVKKSLEQHLMNRETNIFQLPRSIILYDLTNSYFEGQCKRNPKAKRSMNSKENRTDCPQLSMGLVLDEEGFPFCHKVFEGNRHDCKTIIDMVKELQELAGLPDSPTVVLDGGIATEENLRFLKEAGFHYLVNGKRVSRKMYSEDFADQSSFHIVQGRDSKTPVLVKRKSTEQEQILLCRSNTRKLKEKAMVSKTEEKFLTAMQKLKSRIEKDDHRLHLDQGAEMVERNIGKIFAQYPRAAKYYHTTFDPISRSLRFERDDAEYEMDSELHGCYYLRTDRLDLSDDEIWMAYISLTRVEYGFRCLKSSLGLRPFFHQKEDRCDSHVFITVLAYHLMRFIERKLEKADLSWQSARMILQTHCYCTIIIPTKNGIIHVLRKPGNPDEKQRSIYQLLGVDYSHLPVFRRTLNQG